MSKGHRTQKGIKDQSITTDKIVTSKSGSWIEDLESKNVSEQEVSNSEQKPQMVEKKARRNPKYYPSHHQNGSMKASVCVSLDNGQTAVRMKRVDADKLVKQNKAQYASRTLWKKTNRVSAHTSEISEVKSKKKSKKQ